HAVARVVRPEDLVAPFALRREHGEVAETPPLLATQALVAAEPGHVVEGDSIARLREHLARDAPHRERVLPADGHVHPEVAGPDLEARARAGDAAVSRPTGDQPGAAELFAPSPQARVIEIDGPVHPTEPVRAERSKRERASELVLQIR